MNTSNAAQPKQCIFVWPDIVVLVDCGFGRRCLYKQHWLRSLQLTPNHRLISHRHKLFSNGVSGNPHRIDSGAVPTTGWIPGPNPINSDSQRLLRAACPRRIHQSVAVLIAVEISTGNFDAKISACCCGSPGKRHVMSRDPFWGKLTALSATRSEFIVRAVGDAGLGLLAGSHAVLFDFRALHKYEPLLLPLSAELLRKRGTCARECRSGGAVLLSVLLLLGLNKRVFLFQLQERLRNTRNNRCAQHAPYGAQQHVGSLPMPQPLAVPLYPTAPITGDFSGHISLEWISAMQSQLREPWYVGSLIMLVTLFVTRSSRRFFAPVFFFGHRTNVLCFACRLTSRRARDSRNALQETQCFMEQERTIAASLNFNSRKLRLWAFGKPAACFSK